MITLNKQNLNDSSIKAILNEIHDWWFKIDHILLDKKTHVLEICLGKRKTGPFHKKLIISGVKGYEVQDEAQIGLYDINEIHIDQYRMEVIMTSGFPINIRIHIRPDWELKVK